LKKKKETISKGMGNMTVRKAKVSDVKSMHALINASAKRHQMIPRSLNDLYENLRDFFVSEEKGGHIAGTCALHVLWEDLAEIKSLAIQRKHQGKGIGNSLVRKAIKEAKALGIKRVFALTYIPEYFKGFGFKDIDKAKLPHKIWNECIRCPQFPECNELAVILTLK
jgi:amino-acid N-acetyltransferase